MREFIHITHSACPDCRSIVPAKVYAESGNVLMRKVCPEHGEREAVIRTEPGEYVRALRYVKPADMPMGHAGDGSAACPEGCGYCDRHEQHLCMPIVEITSRCNLTCPVCINSSGGEGHGPDMTLDEFRGVLDNLLMSEAQVDVLNISGGEPLLHPDLFGFIDEAMSRDRIVRVSVSTNGLAFLRDGSLIERFRNRDAVVTLQFDGTSDGVYDTLRGLDLSDDKQEILRMLHDADVTVSLVMTAAGGVSEPEFGPVLDTLFGYDNIVSLMVQPVAFNGRGAGLKGRVGRMSIPNVINHIASSSGGDIIAEDFVPLPCSHPLCFSLAFFLMPDEGPCISLNRIVDGATLMDCLANRVVFGLDADEYERLKDIVYGIWSGPVAQAPDGRKIIDALRSVLRSAACSSGGCFDPRTVFGRAERKVKSIFIHAFQDADTFDLSRMRRCCNAYALPDGRLVPSCSLNVLGKRREAV